MSRQSRGDGLREPARAERRPPPQQTPGARPGMPLSSGASAGGRAGSGPSSTDGAASQRHPRERLRARPRRLPERTRRSGQLSVGRYGPECPGVALEAGRPGAKDWRKERSSAGHATEARQEPPAGLTTGRTLGAPGGATKTAAIWAVRRRSATNSRGSACRRATRGFRAKLGMERRSPRSRTGWALPRCRERAGREGATAGPPAERERPSIKNRHQSPLLNPPRESWCRDR